MSWGKLKEARGAREIPGKNYHAAVIYGRNAKQPPAEAIGTWRENCENVIEMFDIKRFTVFDQILLENNLTLLPMNPTIHEIINPIIHEFTCIVMFFSLSFSDLI